MKLTWLLLALCVAICIAGCNWAQVRDGAEKFEKGAKGGAAAAAGAGLLPIAQGLAVVALVAGAVKRFAQRMEGKEVAKEESKGGIVLALLRSRKFVVMLASIVCAGALAVWKLELDKETVVLVIEKIALLAGLFIGATAVEDAAEKLKK